MIGPISLERVSLLPSFPCHLIDGVIPLGNGRYRKKAGADNQDIGLGIQSDGSIHHLSNGHSGNDMDNRKRYIAHAGRVILDSTLIS